jgi:hypothetical protein
VLYSVGWGWRWRWVGEEATESSSLFLYQECEKEVGTRVASLGIEGEGRGGLLIDVLTFMGCFV